MGDSALEALDALAADRAVVLDLAQGWDGGDWAAASGCPGWTVQDVVAHMGALFWAVVDPSVLPDAGDMPVERAQDLFVESRRSWSSEQVLADYRAVGDEAMGRLADLGAQDFEVPLGDLGTYPASLLPNAFAFDHFTHVRADLFAPRGPLTGTPPPSDELRLKPALDWIEAALPQQNDQALDALPGAVEIELRGPAARVVRLGLGDPVARIESDTASFVLWITQRATWDELAVTGSGDEAARRSAAALRVF